MNPLKNTTCLFFILGFSVALWTGTLEADELEDLEKLSRSIEKSLDSLQTERNRIQGEGEGIAARLGMLRDRELLSPKEHREVEKLLRKSQFLNVQMEAADSAFSAMKRRRDETVGRIVEACETRLAEINREVESASEARKSFLLERMRALLETKNAWESKLTPSKPSGSPNFALALQPWNNREEIRLKGDMLLDEAESVRDEIQKTERRIRSLREEREVRRNVSELTKELALFNEHDELLGRHLEAAHEGENPTVYGGEETKRQPGGEWNGLEPPGAGPDKDSSPAGWRDEKPSIGRGVAELDEQIAQLEKYRMRLSIRADSLEQRASWFYRKAEGR
jgi:hypothetical protein